uniref:Uncharacterized protein n=1 Tax=Arundo donax TaxID=35708 RepID=A0A0A9AYP7_ARUDO
MQWFNLPINNIPFSSITISSIWNSISRGSFRITIANIFKSTHATTDRNFDMSHGFYFIMHFLFKIWTKRTAGLSIVSVT